MAQGPDNLDSPRAKRQFTVAFADPKTPRRTSGTTPETSESEGTPAMSSNEALQALLHWKITRLIKSTSHTPPKGTRQPKYYDMHLAPPLQLERIVVLPDLPVLISGVCDKYLEKFDTSPIPLATSPKYEEQEGEDTKNIERENFTNPVRRGIGTMVSNGGICSVIQPQVLERGVVKFTLKATQQAHAKADGFMRMPTSWIIRLVA